MAIILDEFGEPNPFFLNYYDCAHCGKHVREDESEWLSLCQDCGDLDDEKYQEQLKRLKGEAA